jgi:hypothetical protein
MGPDSQRFDQSHLIEGKSARLVQQISSDREQCLHASVDVYSQNIEPFTAIGSAKPAWSTNAAIHVWIDGAAIANLYIRVVRTYFDHLACQFMPQHAGIGVGRVAAGQGMEIAATHSDPADSNEGVLTGRFGGSNLSFNQLAGRL